MPKTKITPKQLYENRNTSDIFSRLIIMGLLRILNNQLKYTQIWEDNEDGIQEVTVPFFYDFSGGAGSSEKFIQDNYLHWTDDECTSIGMKKIDGDYKPIPYGVLTLDSTQIESGNIANRFVMGKYNKKVGQELKSYVSFLYSIPLTMSFTVNIGCDTMNTMWKIEQAYREFFYKNKTFHVNYKGTVVPCRVGFPESITETKSAQYTIGQQNTDGTPDIKLQFNLTCETYQPVFDPFNEQPADQTINGFKSGIRLQNANDVTYKQKTTEPGYIKTEKMSKKIITTDEDILLKWTFNYDKSDLMVADIIYQEEGQEGYELIDVVENHNFYHLQIENDFVPNNVLLDVIIPNNENCIVVNQPMVKFYCDPKTDIVSDKTCTIVDKGFVITDEPSINAILSYEVKDKLKETPIKINITNNAVDEDNPVQIKPFIYKNKYQYKKIKLFIRDHYNNDIIAPFQDEDEWIYVF